MSRQPPRHPPDPAYLSSAQQLWLFIGGPWHDTHHKIDSRDLTGGLTVEGTTYTSRDRIVARAAADATWSDQQVHDWVLEQTRRGIAAQFEELAREKAAWLAEPDPEADWPPTPRRHRWDGRNR